jgi:hypothetical protein
VHKPKRGALSDSPEYRAYLDSPQWQAKRQRILSVRGHRCEVCRYGDRLSLHHLTYARLYDELDSDLLVVCESCHAAMHNRWSVVGAIGAAQHKRYIKACVERWQSERVSYPHSKPDAVESEPWRWNGKVEEEKPKTRRRPMAETAPLKDRC